MKHSKTTYFITLSAFIIIILCGCDYNTAQTVNDGDKTVIPDTLSEKLKDTVNIVAVGDMMLGSAFPDKVNLPSDDAIGSFNAVSEFLQGDIIFGNLEGCFLNSGKSSKCNGLNPNSCYAFRMPERYAEIFKTAGFNVLSIANNHVGDFDNRGRKRTVELLDSLEINYAGQINHPYSLFEKDGLKFAFCAFAPNENTLSINEVDSAQVLVRYLKKMADIVIVSFHGGAEGSKFEHVPKRKEIFYNENRGDVYAFSHAVIDAGADLVLGHGPHVTRAVEVYKNKFIAYSLGNFCTYGMFNLKGPNGIAPLLQLKLKPNGDFISANVISVKQDKINGLQIDKENAAFEKLRFLTDTDFKDHNLLFDSNRIFIKE